MDNLSNRTKNMIVSFLSEVSLAVNEQRYNGSFPSGHNGPYEDPETDVRNTSHFLFSLCKASENSTAPEFLTSAKKALEYLIEHYEQLPHGYYVCRVSQSKDETNGVIGHAWIIEGLLQAYETLNDNRALELAIKLWQLHEFDWRLGIWKKPKGVKGISQFDHTFNHQLWFAACLAPLKDEQAKKQITRFIEANLSQVEHYPDGVIYHKAPLGNWFGWLLTEPNIAFRKLASRLKNPHQKRRMRAHSVGYHGFNLYAIAMLCESGYQEEVTKAIDLKGLLQATESANFLKELETYAEVGFRYNPSGVEIAYAYRVFGDDAGQVTKWLDIQEGATKNEEGFLMKGSPDPATSKARIYQALRL